MNPNDIDLLEVDYYWKDDPDNVFSGRVALVPSPEVAKHIEESLEAGDPKWISFDDKVFYYVFEYREKISDFMGNFSKEEFVIL